jgi:hypothetical protein
MSAWGCGSFENDDAQDFLGALHSKTIDDLSQMLIRAADPGGYLEAPDASVVVAAAEVIAALKGAPPQPLPSKIAEWVSKVPAASPDVSELAHRAVHNVRLNSELKDLWLEADGLNEWSTGLRDLEQRLFL